MCGSCFDSIQCVHIGFRLSFYQHISYEPEGGEHILFKVAAFIRVLK